MLSNLSLSNFEVMEDQPEKEPERILTNNQRRFLAALKLTPHDTKAAADAIGMTKRVYYRWVTEGDSLYNPDFKAAVEEVIEDNLDHMEGELDFRIDGQYTLRVKEDGTPAMDALGRQIRDYTTPPDNGLLKFKLLTKGKHRGYVYRQEVTGADNNPLFGGFEVHIKRKK